MANGKWIAGLSAGTRLEDAARRVLTARLDVIREYLPRVVGRPDEDPENIHQLRVGTRRAGAALNIFGCCLPAKALKTAKKGIRRIRRAAGAARDWDVFLLDLAGWKRQRPTKHRPGLDFLSGYGEGRRAAAQAQLREAAETFPFEMDLLTARTVAGVTAPADGGPRTLGDLARPALAVLVRGLDEAARGDLEDYAHLHQVRILGKRLRYAMEVFADCFGPAFRETLYPQVEEMQEILGRANDSHVAESRLGEIKEHLAGARPDDWRRLAPGIEGLLKYHARRLPEERDRFIEWWRRWEGSGTEAVLTRLLLGGPDYTRAPSEAG